MAIFGRFTEKAQKVLMLSQEEAKKLNHNYIGSEHLLLGLIQEGEGIAALALKNLGVQYDKTSRQIETLLGRGEDQVEEIIGYTPRTKKILELSLMEARALNQSYIGTEHILLGLVREGEGVGAKILLDMGLDFEKIREEIIKLMNTSSTQAPKAQQAKNSNTKNLDKYGRDLTLMADEGRLDPVIGRDQEIQRVIQILSRRTKNNPVLIGEPGVGKTAVAEGLAQKIASGDIPENLKDKRVVSLDLSSMVAGAKYRGEFEDRLKSTMDEILEAGNIILFIDEMHTIIGAGGAEGAIDASNIMKPALARGELQAIGATTLDEYRKHVEKDAALERRFQPVEVGEPSKEEALEILKGLRDRYEAHHKVTISDEALQAAVELSDRYVNDRYLPDKAIDLIDEAASRIRLNLLTAPPDIKELEEQIEKYQQEKEEAVASQDYEKAAQIRDLENKAKDRLDEVTKTWKNKNNIGAAGEVDAEDIAQIVSSWTGVPVKKLAQEESEKLLKMEEILHQRVIGQEEAVKAVSRAIRRARVGLKDPKRPIGSFVFLGPTGVGKTELSKALAEIMFGDEDSMIRIDMSEYMEKHAVSRLIGSPPGYVGYEEGGQLTEKVRRKPYSVILMDEIEKAHPDVFNILLQILEDGRLTDGKGRTVDFKNTVVIMTSNVGAHTIRKGKTLGFSASETQSEDEYEKMKENVLEELKRTFRPEFLNRLDEVIVFHQLDDKHIGDIIDILLEQLAKRLRSLEMEIQFSQEVKSYLAEKGTNLEYGARPLRRTIQKEVEDRLSEAILEGKVDKGQTIEVALEEGQLTFYNK